MSVQPDNDSDKPKNKRGRPLGTPGGGTYNCTTTVVRVPLNLKDKIVKLVQLYQALEAKKIDWEERIALAAAESRTGKPSPRYERAIELLSELNDLL